MLQGSLRRGLLDSWLPDSLLPLSLRHRPFLAIRPSAGREMTGVPDGSRLTGGWLRFEGTIRRMEFRCGAGECRHWPEGCRSPRETTGLLKETARSFNGRPIWRTRRTRTLHLAVAADLMADAEAHGALQSVAQIGQRVSLLAA